MLISAKLTVRYKMMTETINWIINNGNKKNSYQFYRCQRAPFIKAYKYSISKIG